MFDKKQNGLTGDDSPCYAEVVRVFAIYVVGQARFPKTFFKVSYNSLGKKVFEIGEI
jgi:hypothetical protein